MQYTTYEEALADGRVRIRGRRRAHGASTFKDLFLLLVRLCESGLRGRILYREPWWFVTIDEEAFDLVHSHLFAIRQVESRVPTVSTSGYPLSVLYAARDLWPSVRVARADMWERRLAKVLRVHKPGYHAAAPDIIAVYTQAYRSWLHNIGVAPERTALTCQGLPDLRLPNLRHPQPTVGFIGHNFDLKGGKVALATYLRLRDLHPNVEFLVATASGECADLAEEAGARVYRSPCRDEVVDSILPRIDVLIAPTKSDCGTPYGILEALRAGCFVVIRPNPWLSQSLLTTSGVSTAVNLDDFVIASREALDKSYGHPEARSEVHAAWSKSFGIRPLHDSLEHLYRGVLAVPGEDR